MLPFQAEYAKSSRSSCFVCRQKIEQGDLRLAVMVQAKNFDGKIPQWHHFDCFFKATSPPDCSLIQGYSDLRWEDQQKLKAKSEGGIGPNGKSSKTATGDSPKTVFKLTVPAGKKKLKCVNCLGDIDVTIFAGVHVSFGVADSKKSNCMHLDCFAMKRDELKCSSDAKKLDGFKDLPEDTQKFIKEQLPAAVKRKSKSKDGPAAKLNKLDVTNSELEEKLKEQNNQLWKLRDHLEKTYKKPVWESMLSYNNLGCPKGNKNILDQLVDAIYFGRPGRCGECKGGRLIPTDSGYKCIGNLTEWTRCMFTTQSPIRSKFGLGPEFSDDNLLRSSCKDIKEKVFPKIPEDKEEPVHVDSALEGQKPLDDLNVVIDEDVDLDETTRSNLCLLGADISNTINENTAFIVLQSNESKSFRAKAAAKKKVHAIKLIHCSRMKTGSVAHIMKNCNVAQWEVKTHKMQLVRARETAALIKYRNESSHEGTKKSFEKEADKEKIKVSSGGASGGIDGGFFSAAELDPSTSVQLLPTEFKDGAYNAVLNLVDIISGINSYYKLQIVEVPSTDNCYLYRSWGRVGTNIGGSKVEVGRDYDLKMDFKNIYLEKTGNHWDHRNCFEKKPGKFFPVDVDYEIDDSKEKKISLNNSPKKESTLPLAVQKVIEMIFDVKKMENAMVEFEIDLKKMPLGKLSKKQIRSAYTVLSELSHMIATKEPNRGYFIDATNKFYTLIPHDFGVKSIPIIDSEDVVKEKGKMLDNLLEIEVAYSLLGGDTQNESQLDTHYSKLKCDMVPLERGSKDYKMVEDFVKLTHCDTHYLDLVVLDVFEIARGDEESRFKKWAQNDNRMLLWHGSRTTNFAGILSQGLRIAPPEAPRSGYMFGKGIYFADMVTKSANYCCVPCGSEGLMLLAEVALGKQHFLERSDSSLPETLPKGCNSTKGCGRSFPEKKTYMTLENGTVVPIGEQVSTDDFHLHLRYNEYIVYDLSQVQLRYLVKLRFEAA